MLWLERKKISGSSSLFFSLVATFGTTEDFEALLQQQLNDMSAEGDVVFYSGRMVKLPSQTVLKGRPMNSVAVV